MDDRLVTIRSTDFSKAQIIKNRFEQAGIECFLKNINLIRSTVPGGINIRINESDVAQALRIVLSMDEEERQRSFAVSEKQECTERILVPVDFTENSLNAIEYALMLADKCKAEIKLIHVYNSPALDIIPITESHTIQVNVDIMIRDLESKVKVEMEKFIDEIKKKYSDLIDISKIDYVLISGDPVSDILDFADLYLPDIIIIGTSNKNNQISKKLSRFISRIAEHAKFPVLIIPTDTEFKDIRKVENVLYATDFDETDFKAIRKLMNIIKPFNIHIHCIHISENAENKWDLVKIESFEIYFKNSYTKQKVTCSLIAGTKIIDRLNDYSHNNNIGIICLTTHKRNLITNFLNPSTTKLMMHNTKIPLLVFHS